jgi:hypothetical protein
MTGAALLVLLVLQSGVVRPADAALAADEASLSPDHPMNVRLRNNGAGLVPRVVEVNRQEKYAIVGAGSITASFKVPLGWHVIDDGRRVLIFDAGGAMQVNLNRRLREGAKDTEVLTQLEQQYQKQQPDIQVRTVEQAGLKGIHFTNLRSGKEVLNQIFLVQPSADPATVVVARITGNEKSINTALTTALVALTSLSELPRK